MNAGQKFGACLQLAREAKELTRVDVADILKLPVRVIEHLEEQQFDQLPVAAFSVGYLRAYAKILDLDGDELVSAYRDLCPEVMSEPSLIPQVMSPGGGAVSGGTSLQRLLTETIQTHPGRVISVAVALMVTLVSLIIWLVWPQGTVRETPIAEPTMLVPDVAVESAIEPTIEKSTSVEAQQATLPEAEIPVISNPDVVVPEAVAAEEVVLEGTGNGQRITATGNDQLVFSFDADCWVEVRDSSGRNLYSDLSRANTSLNLVGQGPFRILLGYAPGVELYFNGEAIALGPHTRNNVASIMLGQ